MTSMKRFLLCALLVGLVSCISTPDVSAKDKDLEEVKEMLQEIQAFIGPWKGSGQPLRPGASKKLWDETLDWGWKFTKKEVYLTVNFTKSRNWKSGELRYLLDDDIFQFIVIDKEDKKRVFEGELKNNYLTLERTDPKTKEKQRFVMNSAGDGVRFIYRYEFKPTNRSRFTKDYIVGMTKVGASLGSVKKDRECVVTGGLGTMTVSYKGKVYYVCCSGCRDAFNMDPEKIIAEYNARKKKGK